jgi:transposase
MPHLKEVDYEQVHLLPACIEDWISLDHQARFIREFVGALDLKDLKFVLPKETTGGRPAYAPALLLRLWLYGYMQRIRSSRKLEQACKQDLGFIWLCGNDAPDHNSLWRFWNANKEGIGRVFKSTVKVAMKLNLVGFVLQAVDGTKIQAAAKAGHSFDKHDLQNILARLDSLIIEQERDLERSEAEEEGSSGVDSLGDAKLLKARIEKALAVMEKEGCKYVHPHEPEARRMRTVGGNRFSYNAQVVVDQKKRIIIATEVVNEANDMGQLSGMIEQAQLNTCGTQATTLADTGYANGSQLLEAHEQGCEVLCQLPSHVDNREGRLFHTSRFQYDENTDEVICPQDRRLPFRRERWKSGVAHREYRSAKVCAGCPVRSQCTKDRHGRSIEIAPWHKVLEAHRMKMQEPLSKALYQLRAETVEPVFGWIKQQECFRRWTVKGIHKVRAQWQWICSAINLKRIYRSWMESASGPIWMAGAYPRGLSMPCDGLAGYVRPGARNSPFSSFFRSGVLRRSLPHCPLSIEIHASRNKNSERDNASFAVRVN